MTPQDRPLPPQRSWTYWDTHGTPALLQGR